MHRDAGVDHLLDRVGQRADAERLDRDEVPLLRGHVVDGGALLGGRQLAVEPGHLDIEQLAPELGRLLALRAPGRLQAGIGERGLQRLLGPAHLGRHGGAHHRVHAESAEQRRGRGAGARRLLDHRSPGRRRHWVTHGHVLPPCRLSIFCSDRTRATLERLGWIGNPVRRWERARVDTRAHLDHHRIRPSRC